MILALFVLFCLVAGLSGSSSLRILDKRLNCNQPGLDNCIISNCTEKRWIVQNAEAPTGPDWETEHVGVWMDDQGPVSIVNVTWKLKPDASILTLRGSEIRIHDESTNQSMCVLFSFSIKKVQNPYHNRWKFSLDKVVVEPGNKYTLSVLNLPEPTSGGIRITKQITIPESLWDPEMTSVVFVDGKHKKLFIVVSFKAAQFSERYQVSIQSPSFNQSKNIFKENRKLLNVTFEFGWWQLSQCEMLLTMQPLFMHCKNDFWHIEEKLNVCQYYPRRSLIIKVTVGLVFLGLFLASLLLRASKKDPVNISWSAAHEQTENFPVQGRKRVLIIYSLDHPLYKNIVLKFCCFLMSKCGTEVVLDLLDSMRLGVLGKIQWLDWHREQIEKSSDKILILCSKGVQAKWRAMCGGRRVSLREDTLSPLGDMLSPALSLMVPHFIRSASFEKYIVAYFDDVCSEEDVPSPFHITVRYRLMKQFEELFFRILDTEKQQPGRVNHIEGLSEDKYHRCPSGRDLHDAIEAFQAYQMEHPQWFDEELLENSELEVEESSDETAKDAKELQTSVQVLNIMS